MSIDPTVAARATGSIRAAVEAELAPEAWPRVAELVQAVDRALDLGDGATVARLTAELDAVRGVAPPAGPPGGPGPGPAPAAFAPPPSGPPPSSSSSPGRRRRLPVLLLAVVVAALLGAAVLVLGGGDDGGDAAVDDGFDRPDAGAGGDPGDAEETTTTTEADSSEDTEPDGVPTTDDSTLPTTDPQEEPEPPVDVGVLDLGGSGVLAIDLTWTSGADLDLRVVEPDGTEVDLSDGDEPTGSGAEHSGDTPSDCGTDGTLRSESVRWPTGGAQPGEYEVVVVGFEVDGCGDGTFTVAADAGADQLSIEQSVVSSQSRTFRFLADADPAPTTAPPTTEDDVVVVDPTGPADDTGSRDEGDDDLAGVAIILVLTAAAGGFVAWAAGRRRLPLHAVAAVPVAVAHLARPRLPVPAELRELANHTIHRLEVGPS